MSNLEKVVKASTELTSGLVTRTTHKNSDGSTTTTTEVEPSKGGAIAGAMAGMAVGSMIPVVGTAIGGVVGGLIGGIFGPSDKSDKSHQNNNE
jgi:phage tail tape-measure protein